MKTLGILGGMGPEATADFYKMLIAHTPAKCDQEHIPVIIHADPTTPDRTKCIQEGRIVDLKNKLLIGLKKLEAAQVDAIIIPCNTAHIVVDALQEHCVVPIIHIIRSTGAFLKEKHHDSVTLFATQGTYESKLYEHSLKPYHINVTIPPKETQEKITYLIAQVKGQRITDEDIRLYQELLGESPNPTILGCTELPILFSRIPEKNSFHVIDPMLVSIKKIITFFT